jgi:hypothetical protein
MTISASAFFPLVRLDFHSLAFFTAGHQSSEIPPTRGSDSLFDNHILEIIRGLEDGDLSIRYRHYFPGPRIAGFASLAELDFERTKPSDLDIVSVLE